jgi:ArsR family metal-binding transcriptional regulator
MRYLTSIALTRTLPCLAEPGKVIVVGKPGNSLADVIPYLATLPGVIAFNPDTLTLTFRRPAGFMTLYPDKVTITQVKDSQEGMALFEALVDAVNATWEQREKLIAMTARKRAPRHLDVYALLPQTNCQECGQANCLAFAVLLILNKSTVDQCLPLGRDPAFSDRRATLEAML